MPAAQLVEPQQGRISRTASSVRRRFQRRSTSLTHFLLQRQASLETRRQHCLKRLLDIEPLSGYRRWAEFLRLRAFLLPPITTAQSFFRAALAPLQPSEVESAPRFRLRGGPMQRSKPWQWLEHCGPRPSAYGKRILKIAGVERYLGSIRRGQGQ